MCYKSTLAAKDRSKEISFWIIKIFQVENVEVLEQGNDVMVREVVRVWILHFEGDPTV